MPNSIQMSVEECATLFAHPIGIYACASRRFSPRVRLAAFLFTASTQTIWERDLQVQNRRVLLELANNRQSRIDAWKYGSVVFLLHDRFSFLYWKMSECGQSSSSSVRVGDTCYEIVDEEECWEKMEGEFNHKLEYVPKQFFLSRLWSVLLSGHFHAFY